MSLGAQRGKGQILTARSRYAALALLCGLVATPGLAQPPAALVQVDAVRTEPGQRELRAVGQVVPEQAGPIAARTLGTVVEGPLPVGTRVETGDVLLRLDGLTQRANLAEAEALLAQADAELALALAQRDRARKLRQTRAIDEATIEQREQEAQAARARRMKARVDLERARTDNGFVTVQAPFAGVVTAQRTNLGAYVNRGEPVVEMVGAQSLWIEVAVPSAVAVDGLPESLSWFGDSGEQGEAQVYALLPTENPNARSRTLRLRPNGDGPTLLPYAPVEVLVRAANEDTRLSVHKDAVVRTLDGPVVFVADNGSAQRRPVSLGAAVGSRLVVIDGLEAGELVVVRGNERLRPGQPIRYPGAG